MDEIDTQSRAKKDPVDVTLQALKQQNEELKTACQNVDRERLHYQALFDFTPDAYLVTDMDGNIKESNRAAVRIVGSQAFVADLPLLAFIAEKDHQGFSGMLKLVQESQAEVEQEWIVQPHGASPFPAVVKACVVFDATGKPAGLSWLISDISGRRQVERSQQTEVEKQRLSSAYNRSLIEASLDPLVTISPDGKITDVNHATETVTGFTSTELVGTDFSEYFTDPHRASDGYQQVFKHGFVQNYELAVCHRDGHITPVLYNASVFRDESGQVIGAFAAARDMTEHLRAEEQLRIQATALESAANGIFIADKAGTIQWANPAFTRMTGYAAEEILGQNPRFLKSGKVESQVFVQMWETMLAGQVWHGDLINRRKDGSLYYEEQTIAPVFDQSGNITHFVAIKQDVTLRKQAEMLLRQSNAYNRSLIEASLDPLVTISPEGKITDVNHAAERATGLTRIELMGTDFSDYFTDPDRARVAYLQAFKEGEVHDFELALRHRSGRILPVFYNASALRDESGQVIGVFAAARDISERKQAEILLQKETNRVQILAEVSRSLSEAGTSFQVVVERAARRIAELTGDACCLCLLTEEDERPQTAAIGFPNGAEVPADLKNAIEQADRAIAEGVIRSEELRLISNLAVELQTVELAPELLTSIQQSSISSAIIAPLCIRGQCLGALSLYRNRSQPPYTHEDLLMAQNLADRAVLAINNAHLYTDLEKSLQTEQSLRNQIIQVEKFSAVGRIVASVAHEMNNPLQTIKNCLFLARREVPAGDGHPYLDMANAEVQRISRLVAQLRELYRPRTAGMTQLADLGQVLDEVLALIDPHLLREHVFVKRFSDEGRFVVDAIIDQIKQVFLNICLNAIEAMQPNGGTLSISFVYSLDAKRAGVTFQDSGPGIAPENLSKVFQPLFTTKEFGLGLGLSISNDIVLRHGGSFTVESEPGQGAVFTVWLPLSAQDKSNE